jgi:hypothetical protein
LKDDIDTRYSHGCESVVKDTTTYYDQESSIFSYGSENVLLKLVINNLKKAATQRIQG